MYVNINEERINDKYYYKIENNEELIKLYDQILKYFKQNYPEARINYTKNYVGIKLNGEFNRCWFNTTESNSFDFKFRENLNEKNLEENVISHRISNLSDFNNLIPFIEQKMNEEQQSTREHLVNRNEVLLNEIQNDDSDVVKIYSTGSCDPRTRAGRYTALLQYKSHFKVVNGDLLNTTANRCIITGLIEAVKLLKKPCKVNLISSTALGVKRVLRKGKDGVNADIVKVLLDFLNQKQCEPNFIVVEGEGEKLNNYIFSKIPK